MCLSITVDDDVGTASIQDDNMEVPEGPFDVEIVVEAETQEKEIEDDKEQVIEEDVQEQEKEEKICEEDMHEDKDDASNGRDEEGNQAEVEETDNKIDGSPRAVEETEALERTTGKVETIHENLEKETENVELKGKTKEPRRRSTRIRLLSETSNAASGDEAEVQASTKSRTARLVDDLPDQLNLCIFNNFFCPFVSDLKFSQVDIITLFSI